jgi:rare lipoprotein A (peptidoglycan hydrolase)
LKPTRGRSQRACPACSRAIVIVGLCAALAACSPGQTPVVGAATPKSDRGGVSWPSYKPRPKPQDPQIALAEGFRVVVEADPTVDAVPDPQVLEEQAQMVTGGGRYHVGRPYEVAGKLYKPTKNTAYDEVGMASWYGSQFHGRLTANGEIFDRTSISAAHPTMPLPSYVRVTNLRNDRSIVVRVNDRGPFRRNRLIDVSEQTAALLGFRRRGTTKVRVEYVSPAPLDGDDRESLLATYHGPNDLEPRVVLASATEQPRPMLSDALAFMSERTPKPRPAEAAIEQIGVSKPAAERILLAFEAAADAEE